MPDLSAPAPHDSGGDPVDLAIPYALDAVSAAERAEIENWLRTTEPDSARRFDETVRDVRETMSALAVLDAQEPPARLEGRILAALEAPNAMPRRRIRGWHRLAAAAAAVVIAAGVGIGVAVVEQRSGGENGGAVTAQEILDRADTRNLSTEIGDGGTFTVHVSAELGAATVAFSELPAPPVGSDYQLWLIDAGGDPRSAGVLAELPANAAPYVTEVAGPGTLAVTLEPDGGSPAPTSDPLGAVELR